MNNVISNLMHYFKYANILFITRHPCGYIDSLIRQTTKHDSDKAPFDIEQIRAMAQGWARKV